MQIDSEHPIFSPLSNNSRNTVYKLRFASLRRGATQTLHVSPLTCCFHWFFLEIIHGSYRNDNAKIDTITLMFRSLGTTPTSGKTLSEGKGHSRSSQRVPGYSRSNSRNSKFHSWNTKFHSRNGIPRLEQYEITTILGATPGAIPGIHGNPNDRFSFAPPFLGAFFRDLGWSPRTGLMFTSHCLRAQRMVYQYPCVPKQCPADGVWRIWLGSVSRHGLLDTV